MNDNIHLNSIIDKKKKYVYMYMYLFLRKIN